MRLDFQGIHTSQARVAPPVSRPGLLQRMAREALAVQDSSTMSPQASRLASRQRLLEAPGWMTSTLTPSRSARPFCSQHMAQQTWNWLQQAFPGCGESPELQRRALQQALKEFSPGTHEHSRRVGELVLRFANDLGFEEIEEEKLEQGLEFLESGFLGLQIEAWTGRERQQAAQSLRRSGKFHDIGKLAIPDSILHKEGPLSPEERSVIEMHPLVGEAILAYIPGFEELLPAIRHHHERWDGTGYVDGLKGKRIPVLAQLISLSDTFDALTEDRPYRKALTTQQACQEIVRQRGFQFEPDLANAFIHLVLTSGGG